MKNYKNNCCIATLLAGLLTVTAFAGYSNPGIRSAQRSHSNGDCEQQGDHQGGCSANSNPTVLPPVSAPYGKTYDEWSVLWWQWFLPLTVAQFQACAIGQSEHHVAFLLAGPSGCAGTIPPGTSLFFPIGNVECSNLEGPDFFGATAADRNTCAKGIFDQSAGGTLAVSIDGVALQNLTTYRAVSPDFPFTVGPDNVFGITCSNSCAGQSTGYGYYLMIAPLQPGRHNLHIVASAYGVDTIWTLTVSR